MSKQITVLKFGGSVLRDESDLASAVHEIYRHWRSGSKVLAVVSAFGGATDSLLERSKAYGDEPHPEALASLLYTGEATSAALLAFALKRSGVPSKLLGPDQLGLRTIGDTLDAHPVSADVERLRKELESAVVIVSGFVGTNDEGDITLLGRGGTDFTALFLAEKLNARCILVKDVDGLYESDPAQNGSHPLRFATAHYQTVLRLGRPLVQAKAVRFAETKRQEFEITSIGANYATKVGDGIDTIEHSAAHKEPLRVALLGCGTVGGGVYQRLADLPSMFQVVGVVNLDPAKAAANGVIEQHIEPNASKLIETDCDVVIELIGGIEPARALIEHALRLGRHVITANKALIAEAGDELRKLAEENNVAISYSAAVGGALPALEAVRNVGSRLNSLKGIINGTCNFILDQLASGVELEESVKLAQEAGFAEADPTMDLDGTDAAQKLVLLVREGFGFGLSAEDIDREGIDRLRTEDVVAAGKRGNAIRIVAEFCRTPEGYQASVKPVELPRSHAFALTKGAENCLILETENGDVTTITGRGAGRYATAESVIGDLFELRNEIATADNRALFYKEAA